ncbi:hypothetical protein [Nocardia arthritidis]|uniref:Uncharacterized protein n=1 Tax=Nocardia arthritidis TaxID=228602 RepID=A0A6G9YEC6_9NOCA|nr:hypothetical protein [Nocardia arthritidis]QIS11581.1 hypothetical protein F5544_18545 [Nocardia arthritidis]
MGTIVSVADKNVHHLIRQAYNAGGPYQWAREALVNSIQAEATWVYFGVDEESFAAHGVARRYVADNGLGMDEEDLKIFLSSFGGGGRTISLTENFGQGFKASCYEWNPYGIIVISWTKKTPDGRMIWIHFDERHDRWQLKDFEVYYEDSDLAGTPDDISDRIPPAFNQALGIDLRKFHFGEIKAAGHGTVFLFLGDGIKRDTVGGDYKRGEEEVKRGIVNYLNSRFVELPRNVTVRVATIEPKPVETERRESKDRIIVDPDGNKFAIHPRRVDGIKAVISPSHQHGAVMVRHGTRIEWYLTDKDEDALYVEKGPTKPIIAVQYENEAYDRKDRLQQYRQFGIPDAIRMRVWLFVIPPPYKESEPTHWGVMPQASRGMLIGKGSTNLPWEDWQDNFYQQMPGPIKKAIEASREGVADSNDLDRRERLKRTMERLATRFRPVLLVQNDAGRESGNPASSTTGRPRAGTGNPHNQESVATRPRNRSKDAGGTGDKIILNRDESGEFSGSERRKSDGLPDIRWETFREEDVQHAARFDRRDSAAGSFGTIYVNTAFPLFRSEFNFWTQEYPKADQNDVISLVKQVYEDELVSKVMHAFKLKKQELALDSEGNPVRIKDDHINKWIEPEALTMAVLGLVNVEQRIRVTAGSRFGTGRRAKTAVGGRR